MPKTKLRQAIRQRIENILILFGLGAAAGTVAGFGGALWWALDLASHFRVQYFIALLIVGAIMLIARRVRLAMLFLTFGLVNLGTIVPLYLSSGDDTADDGVACRFMLLNVHTGNRQHERVAEEIRRVDPDVLVLQEINEQWMVDLAGVAEDYPFEIVRARSDNFGIAAFSRHPMQGGVVAVGDAGVPSIVARIEPEGASFALIATHPLPPTGRKQSLQRNRQLAAVAETVKATPGPVVVLGDLNVTPWSSTFRALLRDACLRDASRGRGIHATWPMNMPLLLIPIDQCLHTDDVGIVDESVGRSVGSDHSPLIVEARFPRAG